MFMLFLHVLKSIVQSHLWFDHRSRYDLLSPAFSACGIMSSLREALVKIEDEPKLVEAALKVFQLNDIDAVEDLEGAAVEAIVGSKATTVAVSGGLQAYLTRVLPKLVPANGAAAAPLANAGKGDEVTTAVAEAIRCPRLQIENLMCLGFALRKA